MVNEKNRSILLVSRPDGVPKDSDFQLITNPIPIISFGEVLIRAIYLSLDPYMRGRMKGVKTYVEPFDLNRVLIGGVVGEVIKSNNSNYQVGEIVEGRLEWSDYSVTDGKNIRKVDTRNTPSSTALGILGMPGLTAYFGLLDIGQPQKDETVVISGAVGAVGSVVGQIAKMKGCRVVGIAGSDEKTTYLKKELGFDEAINYKTEEVSKALEKACPNGVDIYYDNVGGEISDQVISLINLHSRIVLCGQISTYNEEKQVIGPQVQGTLIHHSALMKGFIVGDYASQHEQGLDELAKWVKERNLKYRENIIEGLENAPRAFIGLFKGENIGKQLIKI